MALKVEKFFCLSLPNATFTIGFLTIGYGLFEMFTLAKRQIDLVDEKDADLNCEDHIKMQMMDLAILGNALVTLSGMLLIMGTVKKCHLLLLPWLVMTVPTLILGIGLVIHFLVSETYVHGVFLYLSSVGVLFLTGFQIYMWMAVFSFSCQICEEKDNEKRVQYNSQAESA